MAGGIPPAVPPADVRMRTRLAQHQRTRARGHRGGNARRALYPATRRPAIRCTITGGWPALMHRLRAVKSDEEIAPAPRRLRAHQRGLPARGALRQTRRERDRGGGRIRPRIHPARRRISPIPRSLPAAERLRAALPGQRPALPQGRTAAAGRRRQLCQLQFRFDPHHPGQRPVHPPPTAGLQRRAAVLRQCIQASGRQVCSKTGKRRRNN